MMNSTDSRQPDDDQAVPRLSQLDQMASRLLDDATSEEVLEPGSAAERKALVDLQWLDAMLEQSHKSPGSTKAAINSVLTKLHTESAVNATTARSPESSTAETTIELVQPAVVPSGDIHPPQERYFIPQRNRRWRSSLAVVGMLAAVLLLWWPWQRQSADAMFERAIAAATIDSLDRVYQVTITRRDSASRPRKAQLTVRGGKKFVFEQTGPLGGRLVIGGNGQEFWLVPRLGPVMVGDSDDVLPEWTQTSGSDMPFLQITTALKRMRGHYELTHLPAEELTGHVGMFHHLVARRRSGTWGRFGLAPARIDLWADPQSGVVNRLSIQWPDNANGPVPEKVELDLTDQVPSSEEVYDYTHYAGDRQIQHLRSSK